MVFMYGLTIYDFALIKLLYYFVWIIDRVTDDTPIWTILMTKQYITVNFKTNLCVIKYELFSHITMLMGKSQIKLLHKYLCTTVLIWDIRKSTLVEYVQFIGNPTSWAVKVRVAWPTVIRSSFWYGTKLVLMISLFLRVQLTITQNWFRLWLGAE